MYAFSHLVGKRGGAYLGRLEQPKDKNSLVYLGDDYFNAHSDRYIIANSPEARNDPIGAFYLIKNRVEAETAINQLKNSNRQLSKFTIKYMVDHCPGWELMNEEQQVLSAHLYAMKNRADINGNNESFQYALSLLDNITMTEY